MSLTVFPLSLMELASALQRKHNLENSSQETFFLLCPHITALLDRGCSKPSCPNPAPNIPQQLHSLKALTPSLKNPKYWDPKPHGALKMPAWLVATTQTGPIYGSGATNLSPSQTKWK